MARSRIRPNVPSQVAGILGRFSPIPPEHIKLSANLSHDLKLRDDDRPHLAQALENELDAYLWADAEFGWITAQDVVWAIEGAPSLSAAPARVRAPLPVEAPPPPPEPRPHPAAERLQRLTDELNELCRTLPAAGVSAALAGGLALQGVALAAQINAAQQPGFAALRGAA